jgi:anti-sigma B factor antagonist
VSDHTYMRGADPRQPNGEPSTRRERSAIELTVASHVMADRTVLDVVGELDLYTAPSLREAALAAAERGPSRLVFDLTGVPFIDSSGLGVIVACLKHLREIGGDLVLVTMPTSPPSRLLSLTGLDKAIPVFSSVGDAVR